VNIEDIYRRYQELQAWVGWTDESARRVAATAELLAPHLTPLIDDFYDEIGRHPNARKVITGGQAQINRLKGTLIQWLRELLAGRYDQKYVARRWQVGWRHVEIGLEQVYTNAALSRLRLGLMRALHENWQGDLKELQETVCSLNKLLDLDLAIIEDAYQAEYAARLQRNERLAAIGQVAQAKARSETAFRTLVEAAPCLIVILRADHTIAYFSPFAEELTGYRADEVLGENYVTRFLCGDCQSMVREHLQRVLAGTPARGFENPVRCRDGSHRWFLWNAQRLADYEGAPAVLKVGQDITALKQAQERTLQAERLAAIGQMVAGLAHESGNALARSQACLEMLALEVEDRPDAIDLVGRIQKAQNHLQQLYGEVRNYAAPLKLERQMHSVRSIWRQAWSNLADHRKGRAATLREDSENVDLVCPVDPFRLEQVFRNILENALAACKDPVEITVSGAEAQLDGQPALRIAVRDNGPGLSAEQRQRIFEPFFTTKTKGTGLGMAIAQRIVEAHGGQIVVSAPEGPGAEIQLLLPRENS
jgi:PAS domain S-box-containing protein